MPDGVKFMALTATASPLTREGIISMNQPKLVYATPHKKNIKFTKVPGFAVLSTSESLHLYTFSSYSSAATSRN